MKKNLIFCTLSLLLIITGCYKKNEEELYPATFLDCDTIHISYSGTVAPLMNNYCGSCHYGPTADGAPVELDSLKFVTIVAANGMLYNALTGATRQMPPTGKLPDCPIIQVKKWIDLGSPGN